MAQHPICCRHAGIRWWQRTSYCQNIPNIKDQPAYNPREEYKNFNCVFPMSQIYGVSGTNHLLAGLHSSHWPAGLPFHSCCGEAVDVAAKLLQCLLPQHAGA